MNLQYITLSNLICTFLLPPIKGDPRKSVQVRGENLVVYTWINRQQSQPEVGGVRISLRKYKYSVMLIVVNNIQLLTK